MNTTAHPPRRLLRIREICAKTSLSRSFIFALVARGAFPAPIKLAPRAAVWDEALVDRWIDERAAESDAARAAR